MADVEVAKVKTVKSKTQKSNASELHNSKRRSGFHELQHSATHPLELVGGGRQSGTPLPNRRKESVSHVHEDVGKEKEVIRKTVSTQTGDQTVSTQTEDRSREQNQDDILAMMTEERPDEGYWEILANRRGQTIEKLQLENESLRSERETMKKEYSEMLALVKEARDLGRLMEEAIERSDEEDADSGSNKPEEEA